MKKRKTTIIMRGADLDIDMSQLPTVAYVVYFNTDYETILETTIHADNVAPMSLITAINMFRPDNSVGCNVTFTYSSNITTVTSTIYF